MAKILQQYSETLINKINSNNAIQSNVNIIKELLDNSIDAGADSIILKLFDFGLKKIILSDNGHGIDTKIFEYLCCRGATTKVSETSDINKLKTHGFRGQALSAIANLCEFQIITKTKDDDLPYLVSYSTEGKICELKNIHNHDYKEERKIWQNTGSGSIAIVTNIFKNNSIRKEAVNNYKETYTNEIINLVQSYALINFKISFEVYLQDDNFSKNILHFQKNLNTRGNEPNHRTAYNELENINENLSLMKQRLIKIFGFPVVQKLSEFEFSNDRFSIEGFISKDIMSGSKFSKKNEIFFYFLNKRVISKMKKIDDVILSIYKQYNKDFNPIRILHLQIKEGEYDINVGELKNKYFIQNENEIVQFFSEKLKEFHEEKLKFYWTQSINEFQATNKKEKIIFSNSVISNKIIEKINNNKNDSNKEYIYNKPHQHDDVSDNINNNKILSPNHSEKVTDNDKSNYSNEKGEDKNTNKRLNREKWRILKNDKNIKNQNKDISYKDSDSLDSVESLVSQKYIKLNENNSDFRFSQNNENKNVKLFPCEGKNEFYKNNDEIDNDDDTYTYVQNGKYNKYKNNAKNVQNKKLQFLFKNKNGDYPSNDDDGKSFNNNTNHNSNNFKTNKKLDFIYNKIEVFNSNPISNTNNNNNKLNLFQNILNKNNDCVSDDIKTKNKEDKKCESPNKANSHYKDQILYPPTARLLLNIEKEHDNSDYNKETNVDQLHGRNENLTFCKNGNIQLEEIGDLSSLTNKNFHEANNYDEIHPFFNIDLKKITKFSNQNNNKIKPFSSYLYKNEFFDNYESNVLLSTSEKIINEDLNNENEDIDMSETIKQLEEEKKLNLKNKDGKEATKNISLELKAFDKINFKKMKIIGQFNRGFILALLNKELFIIDQHAADERFNYETFINSAKLVKQPLIMPFAINNLTLAEKINAKENKNIFSRLGFDLIFQDDQKLLIATVPSIYNYRFKNDDFVNIYRKVEIEKNKSDFIHILENPQNSVKILISPPLLDYVATKACRSSIMIGDGLELKKMKCLLDNLSTCLSPWTCPHGRPTMRFLKILE